MSTLTLPVDTRVGIESHIRFSSNPVHLTPHSLPLNLITGNLYFPACTFLLLQLLVQVLVKSLLLRGRASPYYIAGLCDYRTTNQNGLGNFEIIKFPRRLSKHQ